MKCLPRTSIEAVRLEEVAEVAVGERRWCDGSRAARIGRARTPPADRPARSGRRRRRGRPALVTRASSASASSGRSTWWSVRREHARSNETLSNGSAVASPSTNVAFAGARAARPRAARARGRRRPPRRRAARARVRACRRPCRVERALVAAQRSEERPQLLPQAPRPARGVRGDASAFAREAARTASSWIMRPPPAPRSRAGSESIPVDELVVDRARDPRVLLGEHAVADAASPASRRGSSPVELDGERVHRDRADDRRAARRRRAPRFRSGRGGSRPRSRPGRCRSTSAARRRSGGRSPCSRPGRSCFTCASSAPPRSTGSSPSSAGSSPNGDSP